MGKPGTFKKLNNQDQTITPFKVYKSWEYDSEAISDSIGIDRLVAIKPNPAVYSGNVVTLDTDQRQLDSASLLVNITNNKEASIVWYSLDHLYYKRAGRPYETFGNSDPYAIQRNLYNEASVISIPQKKFGESIKPGSVAFQFINTDINDSLVTLVDDGNGNLIDTELSSSISNQILYLGFNTSTYNSNYYPNLASIQYHSSSIIEPINTTIPECKVYSSNVSIIPKVNKINFGNEARFKQGYIRVSNHEDINFKRSEDFSIAFWMQPAANTNGYILSKQTTGIGDSLNNGIVTTGDVNYNCSQYPYSIRAKVATSGLVSFAQSNGHDTTTLSANVTAGVVSHICFQKTGSNIELYLDGTRISSSSLPSIGNVQNQADLFIGSLGLDVNGNARSAYSGSLNEFFIFNKALNASEVLQLATTGSNNNMTTNTNIVGNVFYEQGMIVMSDPREKYGTSEYKTFADRLYDYTTETPLPSELDEFHLKFNSTVTLYEHEYVCKLKEDEFNFTSNPTIRLDNDANTEVPKDFVANDEFAPYITTVGLYSKNGELLAVGKLGTPIKKRDDVDLNIIVRFDI